MIIYVVTYHSSAHFYQQINVVVLQGSLNCITIQRQTNVHNQLRTVALEFTEAKKNQQELCLNKDSGFKHTQLVLMCGEPAQFAGMCAQLKITISTYLYQRCTFISKRKRKILAFKTQWCLRRSWRWGGEHTCSPQRSWLQRWQSLWRWHFLNGELFGCPTTSASHILGSKVTQQACSDVTQHCGHLATSFLQTGEHFWFSNLTLLSLKSGLLRKTHKNSLFL